MTHDEKLLLTVAVSVVAILAAATWVSWLA